MTAAASQMLVLGAFLAFSLMPVFARQAQAPVLGLVAWRAIVVAVVFGVWAMVSEGGLKALRVDRPTLRVGGIYGLALAVASSTFVGGYALTTVANTVFLHNLAPVVAFPLAWWSFRERPATEAVTGASVAIVGVALMSGVSLFQVSQFANPRFLLGDLSALVSAVGYAAVLVVTRRARIMGSPLLGTLFVAWSVAALLLTALALLLDTMAMPVASMPWVIGLAVVCTNIPFFLLNLGMRSLKAGLTSVLSMSEVVFTTLLGILVYGESLAPVGWLGGGLVVVGLVYPLLHRAGQAPVDEPAASDDVPSPPSQPPTPPRPAPEPPPPMSPDSSPWRSLRLALFLVLFNAGALWLLLAGAPAGALLAWTGLIGLLRLGLRPAAVMLEGRFARTLRWGALLVALAAVAGAVDGLGAVPSGSVLLAAVAIGLASVDAALARREATADRDPALAVRAALFCVAAAQLPAIAGHPAGRWVLAVAALAAAAAAGTVALAALFGTAPAGRIPDAPGVSTLDGLVERGSRPALLGPLVLVLFLAGGVSVVPTSHQAIIERFGYPLPEPADAGLLLRLPPPIEQIMLVDVHTVRRGEVVDLRSTLLCGDQSMVSMEATVHWRVGDARAFAYGVADPDAALTALTRAALVVALAHRSVDDVLTSGRAGLEQEVAAGTRRAAEAAGLGVLIEGVHISGAAVPHQVTDAFLDVISAEEEKRTHINDAQAYAADVLPRSRGRALARLEVAQGQAERIAASSESELSYFQALSSGGQADPTLTRYRLAHEHAATALAPARLVLVSPGIHPWLGDQQIESQRLVVGAAGTRKER